MDSLSSIENSTLDEDEDDNSEDDRCDFMDFDPEAFCTIMNQRNYKSIALIGDSMMKKCCIRYCFNSDSTRNMLRIYISNKSILLRIRRRERFRTWTCTFHSVMVPYSCYIWVVHYGTMQNRMHGRMDEPILFLRMMSTYQYWRIMDFLFNGSYNVPNRMWWLWIVVHTLFPIMLSVGR